MMQQLPEQLRLGPVSSCKGEVTLPGSKSIANRSLLMAALCSRPVQLNNMLRSDDTARMIEALTALGVSIEEQTPTTLVVHGVSGQWPSLPKQLWLGNAGTAMRPLVAVLCATLSEQHQIELDGEPRMRERPIQDLVDSLTAQHAQVAYQAEHGYPPLSVSGGLQAGHFKIDGSVSSQFISALLMALPLLSGDSTLELVGDVVSKPYIDLTVQMLQRFGISIVSVDKQCYQIAGNQCYQSPGQFLVEGDASAASYWMGAAAITGGPITIYGIGKDSIQGDIAFAEPLTQMGVDFEWQPNSVTVTAQRPLTGIDFDGNQIPDAAMTLAPLALFASGQTMIRNVANWRVKETDRLAAMANEVRKTGAVVEEGADYLCITPPEAWQHAVVDTYDDHRMAMCLSLAAFSPVGVSINDPACCKKTYPEYFIEFSRLCNL